MQIQFGKVIASGNDYLVVNTADQRLDDWTSFARWACRRDIGVGADGLVVLSHQGGGQFLISCLDREGADIRWPLNAVRCAVREINHRYGYNQVGLQLRGRPVLARTLTRGIRVGVGARPNPARRYDLDGLAVYCVRAFDNAVTLMADVDKMDFAAVNDRIRHHRATVNIAEVVHRRRLRVRSFEDGVEKATVSSGMGAISSALVMSQIGLVDSAEVEVVDRSGDTVIVEVGAGATNATELWLTGDATQLFTGELTWPRVPYRVGGEAGLLPQNRLAS